MEEPRCENLISLRGKSPSHREGLLKMFDFTFFAGRHCWKGCYARIVTHLHRNISLEAFGSNHSSSSYTSGEPAAQMPELEVCGIGRRKERRSPGMIIHHISLISSSFRAGNVVACLLLFYLECHERNTRQRLFGISRQKMKTKKDLSKIVVSVSPPLKNRS